MSKFSKVVLLVSAIVLVVGLVLVGVGIFCGAKMSYNENDFRQLIQNTAIYGWIY